MKPNKNLVKGIIKEAYGKKCKDFEEHCPVCIAWRFYELSGDTVMGIAIIAARIYELRKMAKDWGEESLDSWEDYIEDRVEKLSKEARCLV